MLRMISFPGLKTAGSVLLLAALLVSLVAHEGRAECRALRDRPWRGLSCLHCLHPNAPGGAEPIVEVLEQACIRRVMLAFVVDGSFGWNSDTIRDAMRELRGSGREVWVHLYVYNGPAQRRWQAGVFHSFAVMHPGEFRQRLLHDRTLQRAFKAVVRSRIAPIAKEARALGVRLTVAPGLEDNLDASSFLKAMRLTRAALAPERAQIVRSPCYGCFLGNARVKASNLIYEEHTSVSTPQVSDGIVHTDGEYFRFDSDDPGEGDAPLLTTFSTLLKNAGAQRDGFLLWVPIFQDAPPGVTPRSPDARTYRAPTTFQADELATFLSQ